MNGHCFSVLLDFGANSSFINFTLAEDLGLITGHECNKTMHLTLWLGRQELQVIPLNRVAITLWELVEVCTPLTVLARSLEEYYRCFVAALCNLPRGWEPPLHQPS